MTTIENITDRQIRQLEAEAFAAGDVMQGYVCRVALGREYTAAELNDESCLSPSERRAVEALDAQSARKMCVAVIRNAEAQA